MANAVNIVNAPEPRSADRDLNLGEVVSRLWQYRALLIASVVVFAGAFTAVAFLMTPVYRASAVLVPASADRTSSLESVLGSLSSLTSIAGIHVGPIGGSEAEEALAVLRSREFTEGFIAERQLMPELYARMWDAETKTWKVGADEQPSLAQAYKYFNKLRTASQDKRTGLIEVTITWSNPEQAAQWVNELVARLNAVMRARAIDRTDASLGYLQRELSATSTIETREAISRLIEAQINKRMLANVTEAYAFRVIDRALVPDVRDPIRPKKLLLIVLGAMTGIIVGGFGVLVLAAIRNGP